MRLRTVALALTLACGFTATMEAKRNPNSQVRKTKRSKPKPKVQRRKAQKIKRHA